MVRILPQWNTGPAVILFLSMSTGISSLPYHWSTLVSDVSYDDLIKLNVTCGDLHSCQMRDGSEDDLERFDCDCGPTCMQLGTCCVDSKYRIPLVGYDTSGVTCDSVNFDSLIVVKGCRNRYYDDDFVRDLCLGNAVALNDPFLSVKVSSGLTGITYRNFFCFVCNVDVDADWPVFWNIMLRSDSENISIQSFPDLSFNETIPSWTIRGRNDPVYIYVTLPYRPESVFKRCKKENVIKTCAHNWTDVITKEKCEAYMALVTVDDSVHRHSTYQNPHCAICNFKDVSDVHCNERWIEESDCSTCGRSYGYGGVSFVSEWSFDEKRLRCPMNKTFDPFSKRCRKFRCGRGMYNNNGKCETRVNG